MKNDQERDANTNAGHDLAPKPPPMVPRPPLIVIGHGATLLPLCPRAKSKWHRAAVAGVGDPGWVGWWRHPRGGEIKGMLAALNDCQRAQE